MKIKILLLSLFLFGFTLSTFSQTITVTAPVRFDATLPASCTVTAKSSVLFYKTGTGAGLYRCSATNTWTLVDASGGTALSTVINSAADLDAAISVANSAPLVNYIFSINDAVAITNDRTSATASMSVPTKTVTAVNTTANTLTIPAHGFSSGDPFEFYSSGTPPAPLVSGTTYYAIVIDANTIKLVTEYSYLSASTPSLHIDLTSAGSGAQTVSVKYPVNPAAAQKTLTVGSAFFNSTDVGRYVRVSGAGFNNGINNSNLDCRIDAFVTTTQVVLNCATGANITNANVIIYKRIPKNVTIKKTNDGKFVSTSGGLLDLQANVEVPPVEIFSGFGVGGVAFTLTTPNTVYPEWFGAKGDTLVNSNRQFLSGTDDVLPFRVMLASAANMTAGNNYQQQSLHVVLSKKIYYLSDTLNVDTTVYMEGLGGTAANRSLLYFAPNKTGLVMHGLTTNSGGRLVLPYRGADFSRLNNFAITGQTGANDLTVNVGVESINGIPTLTLNRVSGTGGEGFSYGRGYSTGNTITIGAWTYVFDNVQTGDKVTLKLPRLNFNNYSTASSGTVSTDINGTGFSPYIFRRSYEAWGANSAAWTNGKIRMPNGVTYRVLEVTALPAQLTDRIKLGDVTTGLPVGYPLANTGGATAYLTDINFTNAAARANVYHGVDGRAPVEISNMFIRGFAGNGIELNSQASPSYNLGNTPNMNNSYIHRNTLYENYGSGLRAFGINSNQILIEMNDSSYNKGAGYMEESFLGNTYLGNHSSYNVFAPTYADTDANSSTFISEYEEGDGTSSRFGQFNFSLGGNRTSGGGLDTLYGIKGWLRMNHGIPEIDSLLVQSTDKTNLVGLKLGNQNPGSMFSFGSTSEPANGNPAEFKSGAYEFKYFNVPSNAQFQGWYGFAIGNRAPLLFSGANAVGGDSLYTGRVWTPFGLYLGYVNAPLRIFLSTNANGLTITDGDQATPKILDVTGKNLRTSSGGDIIVSDSGKGVVLKSPNGTCYRQTVTDAGVFASTLVTCP